MARAFLILLAPQTSQTAASQMHGGACICDCVLAGCRGPKHTIFYLAW